jgi:hypothetical protein
MVGMPIPKDTARDEFKRILRDINKSFNDIYDLETEIARLIMKYCDPILLRKKLKGLVEIE